jgi:parallel beta-helix repeat protein
MAPSGNLVCDNTADGYHDRGFSVESNKNQLDRNFASHSNLGFLLSGKGNKLTENEAADNTGVGFYVQFAEKITLRKNRVLRNAASGFVIFFGEKNKLTENEARLNGQNGIVLLNTNKNRLTHNVALDNNQSNFDLTDQTANCGTNTWRENTFGTASQPCIE